VAHLTRYNDVRLYRPDVNIRADQITRDLRKNGFTDLAANIGIVGLLRKEMLVQVRASDDHGWEYTAYRLTEAGISWILENQHTFRLRADSEDASPPPPEDSNIPF